MTIFLCHTSIFIIYIFVYLYHKWIHFFLFANFKNIQYLLKSWWQRITTFQEQSFHYTLEAPPSHSFSSKTWKILKDGIRHAEQHLHLRQQIYGETSSKATNSSLNSSHFTSQFTVGEKQKSQMRFSDLTLGGECMWGESFAGTEARKTGIKLSLLSGGKAFISLQCVVLVWRSPAVPLLHPAHNPLWINHGPES